MARARLHTVLCDILDIEYPVMLAGMGGFGSYTPAALVAAVSEAGGMGVIGATGLTPDAVRSVIREVRQLTSRPFGVDLLLPRKVAAETESARSDVRDYVRNTYPRHWAFVDEMRQRHDIPAAEVDSEVISTPELSAEVVDLVLEERVPLFAAALGDPREIVPRAHARGMKVLGLAGNVRDAMKQKAAGVDLVVATGTEAGGHTGRVATMPLVPQVVAAVSPIPVVAGGGIGSGSQVAAALALGAVGAWIGTAFLVSTGSACPISRRI